MGAQSLPKFLKAIFLFAAFCAAFLPSSYSEDLSATGWFYFKGGADRLGVANPTKIDFPLEVKWKYSPEGKSNGFVDWGPVATEGVIYTPDGLNNILALDSASGEIVWQKQMISNVFSVTLSEDAKILYVTTAITTKPTATLFALDPKTGEEIWNNMAFDQPAVGGMEGAPAVTGGKIYIGYLQYEGKGGVMAFDGATGKTIWHWNVPRFSPYSPISVAYGRLYVGFENKALVCMDAATGKILWTQAELADLPFAASVVTEKSVYLGAGNTIYAFDPGTGTLQWKKAFEGQVGHSSVAYLDKVLYFGTREGKVFALNASNGEVLWTSDVQKGAIESSLVLDPKNKLIYLGTQENWVCVLNLKDGKVKDQIRLSEDPRGVWKSSIALYRERLYVGSLDKTFYALE